MPSQSFAEADRLQFHLRCGGRLLENWPHHSRGDLRQGRGTSSRLAHRCRERRRQRATADWASRLRPGSRHSHGGPDPNSSTGPHDRSNVERATSARIGDGAEPFIVVFQVKRCARSLAAPEAPRLSHSWYPWVEDEAPIAQAKPLSSRAIAVTTTVDVFPLAASLRWRPQRGTHAFQAMSRSSIRSVSRDETRG